jgi:hypothetical protein
MRSSRFGALAWIVLVLGFITAYTVTSFGSVLAELLEDGNLPLLSNWHEGSPIPAVGAWFTHDFLHEDEQVLGAMERAAELAFAGSSDWRIRSIKAQHGPANTKGVPSTWYNLLVEVRTKRGLPGHFQKEECRVDEMQLVTASKEDSQDSSRFVHGRYYSDFQAHHVTPLDCFSSEYWTDRQDLLEYFREHRPVIEQKFHRQLMGLPEPEIPQPKEDERAGGTGSLDDTPEDTAELRGTYISEDEHSDDPDADAAKSETES